MNPTSVPAAIGLAVVAALSTAANADLVGLAALPAASTEQIGLFSGELTYTPTGATSGTLRIALTNTSPAANGGRITGVVFNIPSADPAAMAALSSATHPFTNTGPESAAPFGTYDAGAALGGSWLGGGNPNGGIGVGQTGEFLFDLEASDAGALSTSSFFSGESPYDFVVRFRGFDNGGSDKVPGMSLVPAPAAGGLLACSGLLALRRRRR